MIRSDGEDDEEDGEELGPAPRRTVGGGHREEKEDEAFLQELVNATIDVERRIAEVLEQLVCDCVYLAATQ